MKLLKSMHYQNLIKIQSLLYFLIFLTFTKCQTQCFTSKAVNTSQTSGPLKLSLTNSIKDFESGRLQKLIQVFFSLILIGSYLITNTNTSSLQRYNCFNLTLMYINPKSQYQVVGCKILFIFKAIQNIQNYQDSQGIDFSIRFSPNQTIIQCLFIMSQTALWTSARIQYIVSAREDFRVGTFIPESVDFLPCGNSNEQSVIDYRLLKDWNASSSLVFGLNFLAGIRTIDTQLNITFGKSTFDTNQSILSVPVSFSQVNYPIEYMLVSYLIVTMASDFQITNIYDLDYIPSDINVFVGMTGVQLAPQESGVLKSTSNITNILSKTKFQEFFGVQGLVIQSSSTLDILFSDGNYSSQGNILECVSPQKCAGYDGYMVYTQSQDGMVFHSKCVLCEKFASYNNITQQCECRDLYVKMNDSCVSKSVLCDATKYLVFNQTTLRCQCMTGYMFNGSSCVKDTPCPVGFTLFKGNCYKIITTLSTGTTTTTSGTPEATSQAPITPINSTTNLTSRNTTTNFSSTHQQQQQSCAPPSVYNETLKTCTCQLPQYYDEISKGCLSCGQNEVYNIKARVCVCMDGAFRINGTCDVCSVNGYFNGVGCQCLPGYLGNGRICRPDPSFVKPIVSSSITSNTANSSLSSTNNTTQSAQQTTPSVIGTISLDVKN